MRLIGLFAWFLFVIAQPAWAQVAPSLGLQGLERRLAATAAGQGDFGMAVMDLDSGQIMGLNHNTPYPMASTMKIAVAAAYLSQVDAGRRTLNDPIAGSTAGALMDRMITRSDNQATDHLIAALGGPRVVHAWLVSNGMTGIRVDRNIADLLAARRDLWDVRDSATPAAMARLLRLIDRGGALSAQSRYVLLDMMSRCITGRNRIRGLLPAGTRIEHKTGTLNNYTGDVGLITLPDGRRIAIVMFARGGTNRPAVIAAASRDIYDSFAGTMSSPPSFAAITRQPIMNGPPPGVTGGVPVSARRPVAPPRMPHPGQPLTTRDRPDRMFRDQ